MAIFEDYPKPLSELFGEIETTENPLKEEIFIEQTPFNISENLKPFYEDNSAEIYEENRLKFLELYNFYKNFNKGIYRSELLAKHLNAIAVTIKSGIFEQFEEFGDVLGLNDYESRRDKRAIISLFYNLLKDEKIEFLVYFIEILIKWRFVLISTTNAAKFLIKNITENYNYYNDLYKIGDINVIFKNIFMRENREIFAEILKNILEPHKNEIFNYNPEFYGECFECLEIVKDKFEFIFKINDLCFEMDYDELFTLISNLIFTK